MTKIKVWINAARPRTLPLSISGILVGAGMAAYYGATNNTILILSLLTTIAFQVTSNLANDYGDGVKGTDNAERIGPKRALQSGSLSPGDLKRGIAISVVVSIILIIALLSTAFGPNEMLWIAVFVLLGTASIWAAISYTVGKSAYGYKGLGDIFVFIFFGLLGVLGTLFLYIRNIPSLAILPAITIGLLSVGVLNLNNLRDHLSDGKSGKITMVVTMGFANGKKYHLLLLSLSFVCMFVYILRTHTSWVQYSCLASYVPIMLHGIRIKASKDPHTIDPELKILALSTFLLAFTFYICYYYFL